MDSVPLAGSMAYYDVSIHPKELLPIVLVAATWGPHWRSSKILVKCNNMVVVNIVASSTSRDPLVMHLLQTFHFITAFYAIQLTPQHIASIENTIIIADAISHNLLQVLFCHTPEVDPHPTPTVST